ncbi:nicotinate-nucleotide adenylyltransferase [Stappia indica]|uniref:Probable nicotinate-nucleotide adenylyltransferase n=1 Tax=Stappia indica TaxID=538381 RepID=A0A857CAH0_9HYPH|nr:nicotinate-nucleotide adenylyltransferase [Stappia indica]QGZ35858.1 nicotinate-nucleotide adenylyltransferase [Stappia indica]
MDPRLAIPHAEPGNRIGLFGGSFNPPHSGHRLVADIALARLGLDQLWWLVTPGNPLKDHSELAPLARRLDAVEAIARHPRMVVTALETQLGTAYSARTLARLTQLRPRLKFVWVMGADNLAGFHRWQDWRGIFARVPIAVVDRPGATLPALASPAAQSFAACRLDETDARLLPGMAPPAWTFLTGPRDASSSTRIRASAKAGR